MNDIFKDMQAKVGCDYISDLPSYKRKVWHEMKRLNPADYEEKQLEIAIGKALKLSPPFPPLHTGHAAFTAPGVPSNQLTTLHRGSTLYALTVHIVLTNFTYFCTSESSLIPFRLYLAVLSHC